MPGVVLGELLLGCIVGSKPDDGPMYHFRRGIGIQRRHKVHNALGAHDEDLQALIAVKVIPTQNIGRHGHDLRHIHDVAGHIAIPRNIM